MTDPKEPTNPIYREATKQYQDLICLLTDVAQLLDGWHADGTCWSEWDESVRKRVSGALQLLYGAHASAPPVQPVVPSQIVPTPTEIAEINRWLDEQGDPFGILKAMRRVGNVPQLLWVYARPQIDALRCQFTEHTKAVADFLNELYAIMVDPCAEGAIRVADMQKALLEAARRDREVAHSHANQIDALREQAAHGRRQRDKLYESFCAMEKERDAALREAGRLREAAKKVLARYDHGDIGIDYKWEANLIRADIDALRSALSQTEGGKD